MKKVLLQYLVILISIYSSRAQNKKVVCYWNSDSDKYVGLRGEFKASDIDPTICTHIIYNSIWHTDGLTQYWLSYSADELEQFFDLKTKSPTVKLLIGIGGYNWGPTWATGLNSVKTVQENFVKAIKAFLDTYSTFDGCDIDWQWPGRGGNPSDKANYTSLLSTLRETLTSQKIISISVAPRNEDIDMSYDIPNIVNHVDIINLNTYDLRGYITDTATAFHAPYRKDQNDVRPEADWNAVFVVNSWTSRNVPREKLTLGIPTYGRSFTLSDPSDNRVGSPISGIGEQSKFSPQSSYKRENIIPYSEICYNINQAETTWESFWSSTYYAPYAVYDDDQWVGYDNEISVLTKLHLIVDNGLGGVNYAAIDFDDFAGNCGPTKFPLISFGYDALINGNLPGNPLGPTTTTERPGNVTPTDPPTETEEQTTTTTTTTTPTTSTTTTTTTTSTTTTTPDTTTTTTTPSTSTTTTTPSTTTTTTTPTTVPSTTTTTQIPTTTTPKITISRTSTTRSTTEKISTPPVTPGGSGLSKTTTTLFDEDQSTTTSQTEKITTTEKLTTVTSTTMPPVTPPVTPNGNPRTTQNTQSTQTTTQVTGTVQETTREPQIPDTTVVPTTSSRSTAYIIPTPPVTPGKSKAKRSAEWTDEKSLSTFTCPEENGKFKNPDDCSSYIVCVDHVPYKFYCKFDYIYDESNKYCDHQLNVLC